MASSAMKFSVFCFAFAVLVGFGSSRKFEELFQPSWALDHVMFEGEQLKLKLDNYSGIASSSPSYMLVSMCSCFCFAVYGDYLCNYRSCLELQ